MKNILYNRNKVNFIRNIFDILNKQNISSTSDGSFTKKLNICKEFDGYYKKLFIDSVSLTTDDYCMDSCCDADIIITILDKNLGKYIPCPIHTLDIHIIGNLHDYIINHFDIDERLKSYNNLIEALANSSGLTVNVSCKDLKLILNEYNKNVLKDK